MVETANNGSDQAKAIQDAEISPSVPTDVIPISPSGGDLPHKLGIYFVLNGPEISPESNNGSDKLPVDPAPVFIKFSMNFSSEKPGEIHDLLRRCVGVVIQTQERNGEPQTTALAVTA